MVSCESKTDAEFISAHLGIQPSRVRENKIHQRKKDSTYSEAMLLTWTFDSPKGHEEAGAIERLAALADAIEPFGNKLLSLDAKFRANVDIVYHVTPQHPNHILVEFDWINLSAAMMGRFVKWNLVISYETIWFEHPDSRKI